jgi:hypothetical protein
MLGGRIFGFGAFLSSAWMMAAPVPGGCGGVGGGSGGGTPNAVCGDGIIEAQEACDGSTFVESEVRCERFDVSKYTGGTLRCNADCSLNTSACVPVVCGNGVIEGNEDCDGSNLNASRDCGERYGYVGGELKCGADCRYDYSACVAPVCGDGVIQGMESCDGANLGSATGQDCSDFIAGTSVLGVQTPYLPGPLKCSPRYCEVDMTQCQPQPGCYWVQVSGPKSPFLVPPSIVCVP